MKKTAIIGKVLLAIVSAMLLMSVWGKFFGGEMAVTMYESLNLGKYRVLLGLIELAGIVMLWVPKWRKAGILLITGYLGGAIMAETFMSGAGFRSGITLIVLWVSGCLLDSCGCVDTCTCGTGTDCKDCKDGVCQTHA